LDGGLKGGAAAVLGLVLALFAAACFTERALTLSLCAIAILILALGAAAVLWRAERTARAAQAQRTSERLADQARVDEPPQPSVPPVSQGLDHPSPMTSAASLAACGNKKRAEAEALERDAPCADLLDQLRQTEAARDAAEAGRARAEADAAGRARFLANMSHELRTPLNAIMGFSDIMRSRMFGDLGPRYTDYAELIHESGRHLLDLINDVLDMSKIEAQRFDLTREVFDAREAVNAALRLVRLQADEVGVKLRGVLPPEPLEIDADRRAIKQIVLNLVSNALKFTPAGGSVTVTADRAGRNFELSVADTGVGIAPEDLERLGRPYEQAGDASERAQGTGLGLSLVRAFAELHGGRMSLESRLGEGTAVAVRLPVLTGETTTLEAVKPAPAPPALLGPPALSSSRAQAVQHPKSDGLRLPKVVPGGVPDAPEAGV